MTHPRFTTGHAEPHLIYEKDSVTGEHQLKAIAVTLQDAAEIVRALNGKEDGDNA